MPIWPNAVLHESQNASMTCGWPLPQIWPLSLLSWWPLGRVNGCGAFTVAFGPATLPVENAAELVTSLNDDPGGKVALMARLSSGWAGSRRDCLAILSSFAPSSVVYLLGSNVGTDARARIAPLRGSMATAAASCPGCCSFSSAWHGACLAVALLVRATV